MTSSALAGIGRLTHSASVSSIAAAHHAAGDVELGFLDAEHLRRQHEQHRIDAVGGDHLARLAARPPGVAIDQPVLAGRAVEPDAARPVQHLPVAADIDAAGVGIARERDVAGADIAAAVARPELRHRKLREVDLVVAQHDLVDRRLGFRHRHRLDPPLHDVARRRDHLGGGERRVEPDRERIALLARAQHVGEDACAGAVAGRSRRTTGPARPRGASRDRRWPQAPRRDRPACRCA